MNGLVLGQASALNTVYANGSNLGQAGPRPLGYLEQLSGIVSGIDEVRARLDILAAKIGGTPTADAKANRPAAAGLQGLIQDAADHVAGCRAIVAALEQAF